MTSSSVKDQIELQREKPDLSLPSRQSNAPNANRCMSVAALIISVALGIFQLVYRQSNINSCKAEEYHNAKYQYPVRLKGDCPISAPRLATIQEARDH